MVDSKRKSRTGDADPGQVKRQRVSRACDQCRAAREKCDGIQPICFTCASSNRGCTYTTNPKRRGIQPGYIRTLELTLAWALANVSGCEESLTGLLQGEKGQLLISSTDSAASNKLHRRWRKNVVCKAIDRVLSGEATDDLFEHAVTTSGDEDEDEEEAQAVPIPRNSILTPDSLIKVGFGPLEPVNQGDEQTIPRDLNPPLPLSMPQPVAVSQTTRILHLPVNYWRLIDVYFAYTHSWLPIASKEQILKLCYSYPADGLDLKTIHEVGEHAELWSILALAAIQDASTEQGSDSAIQTILATAESFLFPVLEELDVGHVSALLTLSLVNVAFQKFHLAWLLLGRSIRGAALLHTQSQGQVFNAQSGSRTRLHCILLGCFVVETVICAQLDIVPSLRSDHAISLGLIPEEGLDEWQPWSGLDGFKPGNQAQSKRPTLPSLTKSIFNQLVKLCYILNDRIVGRLLGKQAAGTIGSQWLNSLPSSLGPLHGLSPEQTTPQKIHLFLTYLVGRALVTDGQLNTIEESLTVFDHFTYTLGAAAMPPLFSCFLHILKNKTQSNGFQHNRLAGILTRFATVWKLPKAAEEASGPTPVNQSIHSISPNYNQQNEVNEQTTPRPSTSTTNAIIVPQSPLDIQQSSPMQMQQSTTELSMNNNQPLYESNYLTRYNSGASMDLDALFDDFTAFDATEPGLNPQFMQNLGYAPNANLAELMTSDFGWGFKPG